MRIKLFFVLLLLLLAGGARAEPVILVFGDSLSAAYGIPRESGWVQLLSRRLEDQRLPYTVINASVSGETTAGGLTRLPDLLTAHRPILTILVLGANDGLRGLPTRHMARNLEAMVELAKKRGSQVLLVGMRLPPNYGTAYTGKFQGAFGEVAKAERVRLVPFLLEGIAGNMAFFQADGLHPDARAQATLLDNVWRELAPMLTRDAGRARRE